MPKGRSPKSSKGDLTRRTTPLKPPPSSPASKLQKMRSSEVVDIPMKLLLLVVITSGLEKADEAILPASYDAIGKQLKVTVQALGSLTLGRSLIQAISCPFISPICDKFPCLVVIGVASISWGVATVFISSARSYYEILLFRTLTGFALSFCIPAMQVFFSHVSGEKRARSFGLLGFGANIGGIFGGMIATATGSSMYTTPIGEVIGWRITFFIFGLISIGLGGLVKYTHDRFYQNLIPVRKGTISLWNYYRQVLFILKKRTFLLIVGQGIVGCMPWKTFAYLALILQRAHFSDSQAAVLVGTFNVGCTFGNLLGGAVADYLAKKFPDRGYILTAQISVASQLPLSYLCLLGIPHTQENFNILVLAFFAFGLFITWCAAANNCLLTDICPKETRNAIFALNYGVQNSISSAAIPVVAFLSKTDGVERKNGEADPLTVNIFRLCAFASVYMFFVYGSIPSFYVQDKKEALQQRGYAKVKTEEEDEEEEEDEK